MIECELCPYGYDYYQCDWIWPDLNFDENLYISDEEGVLERFFEHDIDDELDNFTDPFPWAEWNPDVSYEEPLKALI